MNGYQAHRPSSDFIKLFNAFPESSLLKRDHKTTTAVQNIFDEINRAVLRHNLSYDGELHATIKAVESDSISNFLKALEYDASKNRAVKIAMIDAKDWILQLEIEAMLDSGESTL